MELWRNEMNEEIDRILIESFPTLLTVRTKGWGEILMHTWIHQIDHYAELKTPQLAECGSTIHLNLLYRNRRPTLLERKEDALIDCQGKFKDFTKIDSMWL
eukprot:scaffold16262_cov79-Skeletonema_dohrnii-CCMP3373.AAC.2